MDVRYKIGKLDLCPKVVAVAVEHFVAIDGVENGSKSSGYHLYLKKGVPGEHIIQVGEGVVDILPQPVLNGDEAADTVVWVVVRPGTGTISIDVVLLCCLDWNLSSSCLVPCSTRLVADPRTLSPHPWSWSPVQIP